MGGATFLTATFPERSSCLFCFIYHKSIKIFEYPLHVCNYPTVFKATFFHTLMHLKDAGGMANSVDADQSDLGLHCLQRPVCLKTKDHYGKIRKLNKCHPENNVFVTKNNSNLFYLIKGMKVSLPFLLIYNSWLKIKSQTDSNQIIYIHLLKMTDAFLM